MNVYEYHGDKKFRSGIIGAEVQEVKKEICFMEEGDVFNLGNRTLEIIETPGHSPGSVSILDREHRWLFTGDTCCQADVLLQIEYSQSPEVYLKSINKLIERESQYDKTWPGHHKWPVAKEIIYQFYEATKKIVDGTLCGIDSPKNGEEVKVFPYKDIRIVYKSKYNV